MVYSQLVFINEGPAQVLVILIQDFHLLNLSKTLGETGQKNKIKGIHIRWPSSPSVLEKFNK